jgi:hypothetical protein
MMSAQKRPENQTQEEKRQKGELDKRYGEIGISAVAGAVKHRPCGKPQTKDRTIEPQDCD